MTTKIKAGTKHLYTLEDGEKWALFNGFFIVVHPEREPKIVDKDGNITTLKIHK